MKSFKCDRCGNHYDTNKPSFVVCDVSGAGEQDLANELMPGNCLDLCPGCEAALQKFLEPEGKETKEV